jgi:hypothetical protein
MESVNGFKRCETLDGKIKGYILEDEMYRLGDYNLIMEQDEHGKWRITSFAPFD